jgi:hypothetical protein
MFYFDKEMRKSPVYYEVFLRVLLKELVSALFGGGLGNHFESRPSTATLKVHLQ